MLFNRKQNDFEGGGDKPYYSPENFKSLNRTKNCRRTQIFYM